MRFLLLPLFIFFSAGLTAQYKSFRLSSSGKDTLNRIDMKGLKQGKWIVHMPALRGEPGYEEEGLFVNDRKEGTWRRFNLMGDPLALENYKWGNKHGICRYFTLVGPEHEESWRAVNPDKSYDTIDVSDPKFPDRIERVVVKNEGVSLRHGTWKYFYPPTGMLVKTENYFLDKLVEPGSDEDSAKNLTRVSSDTAKAKPVEKAKPKVVLDFEKKTRGKKNAVRDGRTGGGG